MNKYKTINGKIRHAHAPVGEHRSYTYCRPEGPLLDQSCHGCGYHVCSCPPKPKGDWVYNREMDMLVYEEETRKCNLLLAEAARAHIEAHLEAHKRSWAESYRSITLPCWAGGGNGGANSVLRGNITISLPEDKDEPLSDVWPEDLDDDSWDDE